VDRSTTAELAPPDLAHLDQRPKADLSGPKPDLPKPDLPKPDLPKLDLPKPDLPKPDLPKPDLPKPDLSPASACTSGSPIFSFKANMVICAITASDQCGAGAACNAAGGWHLCKATEYLSRGGKTMLPPGSSWLASCIRSGAAPHAPTDAVCASCAEKVASWALVDWKCAPSTGTSTNAGNVGVVARNLCNRVGLNVAQTEASWGMSYASTTRTQSVCCK
jgi:hypothetical protein